MPKAKLEICVWDCGKPTLIYCDELSTIGLSQMITLPRPGFQFPKAYLQYVCANPTNAKATKPGKAKVKS